MEDRVKYIMCNNNFIIYNLMFLVSLESLFLVFFLRM